MRRYASSSEETFLRFSVGINVCPSGKPCSLSHSTGIRRRILPSTSNTIGASWLHVKVGAELSVFISAPPCPCAMATMFVSSQDLIAMFEVYLVVSFPSPLLGAIFRRTPSNSKSTVAGSRSVRALATTNTRRRRCATPKYWASRILQATFRCGP
ncbi:Uncharacterised protein [Salmonella enterica subsp. enterica serovar Typhi]|nr:Uncharacterised protein [Salmonella enterica subsp. enterica serovar Typhi]